MIFIEIKCHVNPSLGLVEGWIPCIPPVSAPGCNLSGGVALNVCFTTNGICAKNTHIYVARTSNNRVIAAHGLYCCLLPQCEALRTCRSGFPIATLCANSRHTAHFFFLLINWNKTIQAWQPLIRIQLLSWYDAFQLEKMTFSIRMLLDGLSVLGLDFSWHHSPFDRTRELFKL